MMSFKGKHSKLVEKMIYGQAMEASCATHSFFSIQLCKQIKHCLKNCNIINVKLDNAFKLCKYNLVHKMLRIATEKGQHINEIFLSNSRQ